MKTGRNIRILGAIALVGLWLLASLPAQAQAPGQEVATMAASPGAVTWAPRVSYEKMTLTVAGNGRVMSSVFSRGESPVFSAVDAEGYALPDGTYNWEIRVTPELLRLDTSAFSNGKVSADGRQVEAASAPRGQIQSGVFTIVNGALVDSSLVEPESAPTRETALSAVADIDDSDAAAPRDQ